MNLPNKLTLTRILLVPVFMIFVSLGQYITPSYNPRYYLIAGLIFAAASFTDFLDGHLARKTACAALWCSASFWPASSPSPASAWWPPVQRTARSSPPTCGAR